MAFKYEPSNCRWATRATQAINQRRTANGYRGVRFYRRDSKWHACIGMDYKTHHIGYFETAEEAAWMYDQWAIQLHGGDATLNFDYARVIRAT